MMLDITWRCR